MRQLVYAMFISNNRPSFHLWWKLNLVKHRQVSKHYETDCRMHLWDILAILKNEMLASSFHPLDLFWISFILRSMWLNEWSAYKKVKQNEFCCFPLWFSLVAHTPSQYPEAINSEKLFWSVIFLFNFQEIVPIFSEAWGTNFLNLCFFVRTLLGTSVSGGRIPGVH